MSCVHSSVFLSCLRSDARLSGDSGAVDSDLSRGHQSEERPGRRPSVARRQQGRQEGVRGGVCVYCMLMSHQTHTLVCDWLSDVGASPTGSGGCPQQRLRQSSLRLHPEVREQDSREYSVPEGRIITSLLIFKFFLNNLKPDAAMLCLSRRAWSRVNREQTTGVFISTWATPCRGSETTV